MNLFLGFSLVKRKRNRNCFHSVPFLNAHPRCCSHDIVWIYCNYRDEFRWEWKKLFSNASPNLVTTVSTWQNRCHKEIKSLNLDFSCFFPENIILTLRINHVRYFFCSLMYDTFVLLLKQQAGDEKNIIRIPYNCQTGRKGKRTLKAFSFQCIHLLISKK